MGNTSSNAVAQRLDHASKTGVLSLKELKLDEVPEQTLSLVAKLRSLDISFNKIVALPDNIGVFTNLRTLSFNNNKLARVPPSIQHLKKLETLHLQCNVLVSLPESLGALPALKSLDLSHNHLSSLPPSLCSLPNLNYLNVSHNQLHSLPESGLEDLHVLELNVSANSLSSLPVNLSRCKRLKILRAVENCLDVAGLPCELLGESNISLLALEGNLIKDSDLQHVTGYQQYMERYTAARKKMD